MGLSASLISISKSNTEVGSAQQILSKNNYEQTNDSMTTISDSIQPDYSTPFESTNNKSKLTSTKIETSTFSDSSHIAETSQILTEKTSNSISAQSISSRQEIVESSIHEGTEVGTDSISESYT